MGSWRQCALTRERRQPEDLIRFVLSPTGEAVPDLERRLPGRGVWLTATRETVEKAIKTKAFSRSFRADVKVPADLPERIEMLLRQRVAATLSLANKAGLVLPGFQQAESALEKGGVGVLVHGLDAAADGCQKLDKKFQAIQRAGNEEAPIVKALTISEMSLAMGRPSVVHAALTPGGLTERFLREAERLARYRTSPAVSELANDVEFRAEG